MRARIAVALAATLLWSACGGGAGFETGSTNSSGGFGAADAGGASPPGSTPPAAENEIDNDLRRPALGDTLLYIPSASLDSLVVVDGTTLSVDLVEVGETPTRVAALPGDTGAVVLGSGTHDVTIVRPDGDGTYDTVTLDVLPRHNRIMISPDGEWAFLWYTATGANEPVGSLQDVSAVRLEPGSEVVYNLAVGLRPTEVIVTDGGERLVVVTEEGLSLMWLDDLDGDTFLPAVPYLDDTFQPASDREVVVTPDGRWAVIRDLNRKSLTLLDLDADAGEVGQRRSLDLPDWPSDLDMTPDGAQVIIPMRAAQAVVVLDVPDAWLWEPPEEEEPAIAEPDAAHEVDAADAVDAGSTDAATTDDTLDAMGVDVDADVGPVADTADNDVGHSDVAGSDAIDETPLGSTAQLNANPAATVLATGHPFGVAELEVDGSGALLYTTFEDTLAVAQLDLAAGTVLAYPVAKAVTGAVIAPAGGTAVLRHHQLSGLSEPEASSHGYSLVDLDTAYVKLVLTDYQPTEVAFSPDGDDVYVLVPGTAAGGSEAHRLHLFSLTRISTPSRPVFVGLLPDASQVAILLDDPTGWLTLVDVETGQIQQINSFELNSQVR